MNDLLIKLDKFLYTLELRRLIIFFFSNTEKEKQLLDTYNKIDNSIKKLFKLVDYKRKENYKSDEQADLENFNKLLEELIFFDQTINEEIKKQLSKVISDLKRLNFILLKNIQNRSGNNE